jgi:catechol 2,3-dioxygenase-like lactoylglutathione lyase family enzyme
VIGTIDHIVIAVRDLPRATADYERAGFTVTPGGEHADGATHNALISFGDGAYVELIAFKEPDRPQPHRWWSLLTRGEGTVDFALRSDDLVADATRLREAGLVAPDPREGGRLRPDGQRIGWRNLELRDPEVPLPFLIEDVTPRDLRVPAGPAMHHPLGVERVDGVTILVADLDRGVGRYAALLGSAEAPSEELISGVRAAHRFPLPGNERQWIELAEPEPDATESRRHLAERGSGPYRIVLGGADTAATTETLPMGAMHGARIVLGS